MRYQVKDQGKLPAKFKWPIWCKIWFFASLACFILTLVAINIFKNSNIIDSLRDSNSGWGGFEIFMILTINLISSFGVPYNLQQNYNERRRILLLLSQGPKTAEEIHNALQPDPTIETEKKLKKLAKKGLIVAFNNG